MKRSRWYAIRGACGRRRAPAGKSAHGIDHRAELPQGRLRHLHALVLHRVEASPDKQILQKRFPVGYAFVNLSRLNFEELRRVDGVVCFLRGANYGPLEFPDGTIEALYFAEHERRQAFLYEQHCRKENERPEQIQHLRGQLRKILPKGRKARVSMAIRPSAL